MATDHVVTNRIIWKDTTRRLEEFPKPNSKIISPEHLDGPLPPAAAEPFVRVYNKSQLAVAAVAAGSGLQPIIHLSAVNHHPSPSVEVGASGLEFNLIRQSNYIRGLPENYYPLLNGRTILSENVTLFKDEAGKSVKPYQVSVLASVPLSQPDLITVLHKEQYQDPKIADASRERLRAAFKLAAKSGRKSALILSDYGRRYGHPVSLAIEWYNQLQQEFCLPYVLYCIEDRETFIQFHEGIMR